VNTRTRICRERNGEKGTDGERVRVCECEGALELSQRVSDRGRIHVCHMRRRIHVSTSASTSARQSKKE
jgi:hypothetical protein